MRSRLLRTIGDTILMVVKPWFSHEVGKDFRKRENGGGEDYDEAEKGVKILSCNVDRNLLVYVFRICSFDINNITFGYPFLES